RGTHQQCSCDNHRYSHLCFLPRDPMKISGNASELLISELRVGLDYLKQLSSTAFAEVRAREQSTAWHRRFSKCPSVLAACQSELAQGRLQFRPDGVQIPFSPL